MGARGVRGAPSVSPAEPVGGAKTGKGFAGVQTPVCMSEASRHADCVLTPANPPPPGGRRQDLRRGRSHHLLLVAYTLERRWRAGGQKACAQQVCAMDPRLPREELP